MRNKKTKKNGGFSLIETMMAVFVVSAGMVAVLGLMSKTLSGSMDSRDQIIAVLLAQEGVELVQNLRDNNWAGEDDAFENGFPAVSNNGCIIDYDDLIINSAPASYVLRDNSGFYEHDAGSATKFTRRISISYNGVNNNVDADSANVYSIVKWDGSSYGSDPSETFPIDDSKCNTSTKCAFTQITLTRWGWN